MKSVKVSKEKLLKIVKENKEKHVSEYDESVVDYKEVVLKISKENFEIAQSGDLDTFKKMKRIPSLPVSYEDEYNKSLRMLEMSVEDDITLSEREFTQLVLDEWHWKHSFNESSMSLKAMR